MTHAIEHQGHATDPGTEVVDLADELALLDVPQSWLDVEPHEVTPDLARLTGHVTDYEWATWTATALRRAGLSVAPYPSWTGRGRPRSSGPFTPRGLVIHHDASPKGPSPAVARFLAEEGRPAEGIPAPLSQLWVCAGCDGKHPVGTWHVLAAGRANHAGTGSGFGKIGADLGSSLTLGVETDNTTGEPTPQAMYDSLVVGSAALLQHMRSDPMGWLAGHKEYAKGRKIDPDDVDMGQLRDDVAAELHLNTVGLQLMPFPGVEHFRPRHDCQHGYVEKLETWLLELPGQRPAKSHPRATFSKWTQGRVAAFQRSVRVLASDPDGIPGPITWRRLQLAVRGVGGGPR